MKHNRQRGGTLLGIVIGLVIGLGIALTVAMVITKTPIPFVDRSGHQKAAKPSAAKPVDPNQPLYGRRVTPPAEVAPPPNTAAPDVRIAPPGAGAPIVEQSLPTAESEPVTGEKWDYYLQAGAFSQLNDAESMRAKLALLGVEASISERQADTGLLYRVRAGPFDGQEGMNRMRAKLSDNGIDVAVVRMSR